MTDDPTNPSGTDPLADTLRASLGRRAAGAAPHPDVADLTDRIAVRTRRNQRLLSVAAAMVLVAGVAGGVAIGHNTASHPTQTAKSAGTGERTNGLQAPMAGGAGATMDLARLQLTKVLVRTANGVTVRLYTDTGGPVVQPPTEPVSPGDPTGIEPQVAPNGDPAGTDTGGTVSSPGAGVGSVDSGSTSPGSAGGGSGSSSGSAGSGAVCSAASRMFWAEASNADVAQQTVVSVPEAGVGATAQVYGVSEGSPFVVVVVHGTADPSSKAVGGAGAPRSIKATLGGQADVAAPTALPNGAGWATVLALALPAGSTGLADPIALDWSVDAGSGATSQPGHLTLDGGNPSASTDTTCASDPTCSKAPASGACPPTTVPTPCVTEVPPVGPKTTLPPNPGGPDVTVQPGATPQLGRPTTGTGGSATASPGCATPGCYPPSPCNGTACVERGAPTCPPSTSPCPPNAECLTPATPPTGPGVPTTTVSPKPEN